MSPPHFTLTPESVRQELDLLYRMQCELAARVAALEAEIFLLKPKAAPRRPEADGRPQPTGDGPVPEER